MTPRPGAVVETSSRFLEQLREGWHAVVSRRWLRSFMVLLAAYHLIALPCVLALGPVVAERELSGASSWAAIVTAFAIGSIVGAALGLRAHPRGRCACAPSPSSAPPASRRSSPARAARWRSGRSRRWPVSAWRSASRCGRRRSAVRSRRTLLSRVTSFDWFSSVGLMPLGYALVGPLADAIGLHATMFGATVIVASLAAAYLAGRPHLKRR